MAKEFFYRGKTLEELKKLNLNEFAELLPARQRRSVLRQTENIKNFLERCKKKIDKNKKIKTHKRDLVIIPQLVGLTLYIYNGKEFLPVTIVEEMMGHKLGEFAFTRKKIAHGAAGIGATRSSAFLSVK